MRDSGGGRKHASDGLVKSEVAEDGTIESISDPPALSVQGLGGSFDLTDPVMRALGMQPYEARRRKLMDRTRAQRMEMASSARARRLRQSLRHTHRDLAALWARNALPPARRRALIFQLWDECAERGPGEVVATSRAVRATIETFVRKRLPAGSPDAFTAAELERLNARRSSSAAFSPYR
jgi:hypothetical protein